MSNERNEKAARKMLDDMDLRKEQLHEIKKYPAKELEFMTEATNEVIRCRQILKWCYVYGYYNNAKTSI